MRVVAGEYGGRTLRAPPGSATRPTSDRVREALFSILGPPALHEGEPFRALDLFAGSGALGIEAVSRGADEAVLVDEDPRAVRAAQRNVEELGLSARVRVVQKEVGAALRRVSGRFGWIFADPPYDTGSLDRALRLLGSGALLAPGGVVAAEHSPRGVPADRYGRLALHDRRSWGQTSISFYRITDEANP